MIPLMKVNEFNTNMVNKLKKQPSLRLPNSKNSGLPSPMYEEAKLPIANSKTFTQKKTSTSNFNNGTLEDIGARSEDGRLICTYMEPQLSDSYETHSMEQFCHIGSLILSRSNSDQSRQNSNTMYLSDTPPSILEKKSTEELVELRSPTKKGSLSPNFLKRGMLQNTGYEIRKVRSRDGNKAPKKLKNNKGQNKPMRGVKPGIKSLEHEKGIPSIDEKTYPVDNVSMDSRVKKDIHGSISQRRKYKSKVTQHTPERLELAKPVSSENDRPSQYRPIIVSGPSVTSEEDLGDEYYEAQLIQPLRVSGAHESLASYSIKSVDIDSHKTTPEAYVLQRNTLNGLNGLSTISRESKASCDGVPRKVTSDGVSAQDDVKIFRNTRDIPIGACMAGNNRGMLGEKRDGSPAPGKEYSVDDASKNLHTAKKSNPMGSPEAVQQQTHPPQCPKEHHSNQECPCNLYETNDVLSNDKGGENINSGDECLSPGDVNTNISRNESNNELQIIDDVISDDEELRFHRSGTLVSEGITYDVFEPTSSLVISEQIKEHCIYVTHGTLQTECNCPNIEVHNGLGMTMPLPLCLSSSVGTDEHYHNLHVAASRNNFYKGKNMSERDERTCYGIQKKSSHPVSKAFSMTSPNCTEDSLHGSHREYSELPLIYHQKSGEAEVKVQEDQGVGAHKQFEYEAPGQETNLEAAPQTINVDERMNPTTNMSSDTAQIGGALPGRLLFYGLHGPNYQYYRTLKHPNILHDSTCTVTSKEMGFDSDESLNKSLNAQSEIIIRPPAPLGGPVFLRGNVAKSMRYKGDYIANAVFAINWPANKLRRKRYNGPWSCCTQA